MKVIGLFFRQEWTGLIDKVVISTAKARTAIKLRLGRAPDGRR
jgi:hypothetical protein